jgi:hypothetical protein
VHKIVGEDDGHWRNGTWFSNYSYLYSSNAWGEYRQNPWEDYDEDSPLVTGKGCSHRRSITGRFKAAVASDDIPAEAILILHEITNEGQCVALTRIGNGNLKGKDWIGLFQDGLLVGQCCASKLDWNDDGYRTVFNAWASDNGDALWCEKCCAPITNIAAEVDAAVEPVHNQRGDKCILD